MVFCFVQNFFFGQHKSQNIYFLSREARIFSTEINIRLYDKNSESDHFFFLHQIQNIFFEKHHNPPLQVKWSFPKYYIKIQKSLENFFIQFSFRFLLQTSTDFTAVLIMSSMIPLIILSLDTDETVRNLAQNFLDRSCAYSCSCSISTNNVFPNLLSF